MKILIVGAGFSGCVIAEQLSRKTNSSIVIVDEREHIGGNCYSERDKETNVMVHKYGPHIFNTDNKKVWEYINQFCEMQPFINRVKAEVNGSIYSMPINLHTINQFFHKTFNPSQAREFIAELGDSSIMEPKNFEEQALKMIGKELYEAFFYGYTKKQWGCDPKELSASILKRLPVRFNYDDNYYANPYQGIPKDGYTAIFEKMLDYPQISVKLNTKFDNRYLTEQFDYVFYTGPIDAYFNFMFGRLGYRTVIFERGVCTGDYQGNAVINYPDSNVLFTRVHEHKHFAAWENHDKSVYFKEYSKENGKNDTPYYPKRLGEDLRKFELYWTEVEKLSNVTFLGRLARYRYMDMHHVINEALEFGQKFIIENHLQ